MDSSNKRESQLVNVISTFFRTLTSDTLTFLKIIAPVLLAVSFTTVLIMWLELSSSENIVVEPIRDILDVPLMLFGVIAIINVIIFRESSSSTFLAVFVIGTVIAGPELADRALRAATGTAVVYENSSGGLGHTPYGNSGGLLLNEDEGGDVITDTAEGLQ